MQLTGQPHLHVPINRGRDSSHGNMEKEVSVGLSGSWEAGMGRDGADFLSRSALKKPGGQVDGGEDGV